MTRWYADAACAGQDVEAWFPTNLALARRVIPTCHACPVRAACLDEAMTEERGLSVGDRYGVRGGRLPGQRAALDPTTRRPRKREQAA